MEECLKDNGTLKGGYVQRGGIAGRQQVVCNAFKRTAIGGEGRVGGNGQARRDTAQACTNIGCDRSSRNQPLLWEYF